MKQSLLHIKVNWLVNRYVRNAQSGVHRLIAVRDKGELVGIRMDAYHYPNYEDRDCFGDVLVVYNEEPAPFLADNPDFLENVIFYRTVEDLPVPFLELIVQELEKRYGKAPFIC